MAWHAKRAPNVRDRIPDTDLTWTPDRRTQRIHRRYLKSLPDDDPVIRVYRFVQRFYADYQSPPTFTQVAVGMKAQVKSNNTVLMALKRLVLAGWIERIYVPKKRGDGSKYKPVVPFSDMYKRIVAFVQKYYVEQSLPPNVRMIARAVGHLKSDGKVREIVKNLVMEGYLQKLSIEGRFYYKPPDYGVVNLNEYYTVLNWAAAAKKKAGA